MTEHSVAGLVASNPEHPVILVEAHAIDLKRKARNTRALALCSIPLFLFSLICWIVWMGSALHVWSYLTFICAVVGPSLAGVALIRWSIRRAMVFDREASAIVRGLSEPTLLALAPLNLSNVSASTTSAGITRRIWGTRFKRLVNVALLALFGVIFASGGCVILAFIYVIVRSVFFDGSFKSDYFGFLGLGGIVAAVGVVGCMRVLKSGQHLLQTQESLVEVGTHLAGADAQPGSLQLSDSLVERGQLSLKHKEGGLTQTSLLEHREDHTT